MNEVIYTVEGTEHNYPEFLNAIESNFNRVAQGNLPLFKTNTEELFDVFLKGLPEQDRQHYTCRACKHFVERFGDLVTLTEDGVMKSAIWDTTDIPQYFLKAVKEMKKTVEKSKVVGVFLSDERVLGTPKTGEWKHMAVELPCGRMSASRLKNASQLMAEKREEFGMLNRGLAEFSSETVETALTILQSEALYRSDRFVGVANFLKGLHDKCSSAKNGKVRDNIVWYAVAKAPQGYCHVKSSMIGTLLDDINSGYSFDIIKRRFDEKMETYMRSQATPTENAIFQAEKVVAKLGIAESLERRYATIEEIPEFLWKKKEKKVATKAKKGGVFGHIPTVESQSATTNELNLPTSVMTWEKFKRTVLPTADKIEAKVDNLGRLMAMIMASDPTTPNILQWDNPFSWYYHKGIDGEIKRRVEEAGGRYENNEIRCSLIWEGLTDLDLHCKTPKGEHIYYSQKRTYRCGGYLDLDMNGVDESSETPVENMRWADNAPEGRYQFYVHNYDERVNRHMGTPFKVELEIDGEIYTYHGQPLLGGRRVTVFEFDYKKGQKPVISTSSVSHSVENSWNVEANSFVEVKGITTSPNLWGERPVTHTGNHTFFLLDGCKDLSEGKGRGFFNEMLKPELREIRKTLEAYTANTPIEGADEATACGLGFSKDSDWDLTLKVTTGNSTRVVKIDRFD